MPLTRMDLDAKGAGSPEGLVARILKLEPNLAVPIPITDLCRQLDIQKIERVTTEGCEGALLTDADRSQGIILFNDTSSKERGRFTIAHELGHFLIPSHIPNEEYKFLCSREDMRLTNAKNGDRRAQMEVEANKFASLILIPPPMLRLDLKNFRAPDVQHIPQLARRFEVSKEAMARAYVERHDEPLAVVIVRDGRILRSYRDRGRFPFLQPARGQHVPRVSSFYRVKNEPGVASGMAECIADTWIETKFGERAPALLEQVLVQREGFAMILLHLVEEDEEELEARAIDDSWRPNFGR